MSDYNEISVLEPASVLAKIGQTIPWKKIATIFRKDIKKERLEMTAQAHFARKKPFKKYAQANTYFPFFVAECNLLKPGQYELVLKLNNPNDHLSMKVEILHIGEGLVPGSLEIVNGGKSIEVTRKTIDCIENKIYNLEINILFKKEFKVVYTCNINVNKKKGAAVVKSERFVYSGKEYNLDTYTIIPANFVGKR